ncbi:ATP-grasp domain-containing protein [Kribbella sp. CA-293567]|uniref:ATP-grasp domain-containing protein n=1 Tax=Kribbella sp. CA-293567 TaxID=3002436 RepID=UPI0022DD6B65|nr:ATP-grasp domain-containing protein [Kribbella sp. CA-293567]WBQ08195.1 ATP-grasp domain-containing protein [Kribbella sp. CA-293567]
MRLYLLALPPTDSVTEGFLPAALRLGFEVTVLTDRAEPHRRAYAGLPGAPEVVEVDPRDFREVISFVSRQHVPAAIFSNSDHLQTQTALAAQYFGLPGKDWKATFRAKNKAQLRRHLAGTGLDTVRSVEVAPGNDPGELAGLELPFPAIVKPREGVASEDVALAGDLEQLLTAARGIRERRPDAGLVVEEYLEGQLYTLETLGDGTTRHVLGGFRTEVVLPTFIEKSLEFVPQHPRPVMDQLLAQLDAVGVGLGACHTEFVVQPDGRARIIEVNYRAIGDRLDLLLPRLLGIPYFELVLRAHLGESLPADLGIQTGLLTHSFYLCADRAGVLTAAPAASDLVIDGVEVSYRPLRAVGEHHPLYGTNRDYLGVVEAMGPELEELRRVTADFVAAHEWTISE